LNISASEAKIQINHNYKSACYAFGIYRFYFFFLSPDGQFFAYNAFFYCAIDLAGK